jgi:DNA-binding response OmpR family regulator
MNPPPPAGGKGPLLLIADDDVDTLNILQIKLEAHGFRVLTSRDGYEALATMRRQRPALLILDIMMPRLNGFQVTRMVKFDKRLKAIPILLLTARTQKADRELGLRVGADEYMTKPFDPQQLLDMVNRRLKRDQGTQTGGA